MILPNQRLKTLGDFDQQHVDRVFLLITCAVAITGLAALVDYFTVPNNRVLLFTAYAINIALGAASLWWMSRRPTRRTATTAAIVMSLLFCLGTALSGIIAGGYAATTLFCMGLLWVTAAMLPWGLRPQLVVCAGAALSMLITFLAHGDGIQPGFLARDVITLFVGASFSLFVAKFLAIERQEIQARLFHTEAEIQNFGATLERNIQERTAELEIANLELQAFSYSVSHDLRGPLRAIEGFAELVLDESSGSLDAASASHITRVRAAALRMDRIIDDLLTIARIARREISDSQVNLSAIAQQVVDDLRSREDRRKNHITVTIAPGLMATGDRGLLTILLENLLGNSWKFVGNKSDAHIEFDQVQLDGEFTYMIRDNGVGFDMRFVGKLFAPFEKLHDDDDFPGSGIGLALVERIVRRHRGDVWAEARPGSGASFYFRLPLQASNL